MNPIEKVEIAAAVLLKMGLTIVLPGMAVFGLLWLLNALTDPNQRAALATRLHLTGARAAAVNALAAAPAPVQSLLTAAGHALAPYGRLALRRAESGRAQLADLLAPPAAASGSADARQSSPQLQLVRKSGEQ